MFAVPSQLVYKHNNNHKRKQKHINITYIHLKPYHFWDGLPHIERTNLNLNVERERMYH